MPNLFLTRSRRSFGSVEFLRLCFTGRKYPEMKTVLRNLSIGVLIVVGAALVLLFTPIGDRPLTALFSVGDVENTEFAEVKLTGNPNQFLMCPPGYCGAKPHVESSVFDLSVTQLREHWHDVVAAQPRIALLGEDEDGYQFDYVQRSARFRFPDVITVRFISISSSQSTLAIFGRAIYGKSDFGVNRKRIEAWLTTLGEGL